MSFNRTVNRTQYFLYCLHNVNYKGVPRSHAIVIAHPSLADELSEEPPALPLCGLQNAFVTIGLLFYHGHKKLRAILQRLVTKRMYQSICNWWSLWCYGHKDRDGLSLPPQIMASALQSANTQYNIWKVVHSYFHQHLDFQSRRVGQLLRCIAIRWARII